MRLVSALVFVVLSAGISVFSLGQSVAGEGSSFAAANSVPSAAKPATGVAADDYTIGADDTLAINVWKEPDLCRTVPVRPDGKITLPLIGDVQASGKTPRKLQEEIQESLTEFVAVPDVTVIVQEVKSLKFNIVGEVVKPGSYPLTESTTVLDAIAVAGGLGEFAKRNSIYVLRVRSDGSSERIPFRYKQVLKGSNLSQNVQLQAHDTVVVP
jgi:polysaccharide export outer membrane protein